MFWSRGLKILELKRCISSVPVKRPPIEEVNKEIKLLIEDLVQKSKIFSEAHPLLFNEVHGNIFRKTLPKEPECLKAKTRLDQKPDNDALNYLGELVSYNYLDRTNLNSSVYKVHKKHPHSIAISTLYTHHVLKRGSDMPFMNTYYSSMKYILKSHPLYYELFSSLSINTDTRTELSLLFKGLERMIKFSVPVNTKLIQLIYLASPKTIKDDITKALEQKGVDILKSFENTEIDSFKSYNELEEYIKKDVRAHWNYLTMIKFCEFTVKEERYMEFFSLIAYLSAYSHCEVPIGMAKYIISLVYKKSPELVFSFQRRLSDITGCHLYPYTATILMDGLLEKQKNTEAEQKLIYCLYYSDSCCKKFKKYICHKFKLQQIPKPQNFEEIVVNYLKKSSIFFPGAKLSDFETFFEYFDSYKRKQSLTREIKQDLENKKTEDIWNSIVKIENADSFKLYCQEFVKILIERDQCYFVLPLVKLLKDRYNLDITYDSQYQVLLKLVDYDCVINNQAIALLFRHLKLINCQKNFYAKIKPIVSEYISEKYRTQFLDSMTWQEDPVWDLNFNDSKFIHFSRYLSDYNDVIDEYITDGKTQLLWDLFKSSERKDLVIERIVNHYVDSGKINYVVALINSPKIQVDNEKLLTKCFEAYYNPAFKFSDTNIIGLEILVEIAKRYNYELTEDLKNKIEANIKSNKISKGTIWTFKNMEKIERVSKSFSKMLTNCELNLLWDEKEPEFRLSNNNSDFKTAGNCFVLSPI